MSFPAYSTYKDSGAEWLGEVPSTWDTLFGKRLFKNSRASAKLAAEQLAATQAYGVVPQKEFMEQQGQKVVLALSGTENFKDVEVGDFVISLRSFQGGLEYSGYDGCVSPAYTVLRPIKASDFQADFFRFLLKSDEYIAALQSVTTGIREGRTITFEQFGSLLLPVPPKAEQTQIARFLEYETARIDALIDEQQRLIELLKEKRQAAISHAVTKGLDHTVPMKDSGVEWLGEVPTHWAIRKLKNLVSVQGGSTPSKEIEHYWIGEIPWVSPKDMKRERLRDSIDHVSTSALEQGGLNVVAQGSVLIVVRGMILLHSVPVAIADVNLTINQDIKAMKAGRELSGDYLLLLLQGVRDAVFQYIDSSAHGTRKLEWERFELFDMPIPPLAEQQRVIDFVESQKRSITDLASQATAAIDLMKERRSALVSAAVTGKIDVRGWQPPAGTQTAVQELEEAV